MNFPILVAHGALGYFDDVIIPIIGIVFIGLVIFTWWSSRNQPDNDEQVETPDDAAALPTPPTIEPAALSATRKDDSHYRLD